MTIVDSITAVSNAMLRYRDQWVKVPDELKEKWFFVINRYLSKDYPEQAFLLNQKTIDKVAAMNIWYAFFNDKPYPENLWSKVEKTEKNVKKTLFSQKDLLNLQNELNINESEMEILVTYHSDEVKEEIKYLKQQKEQ